MIKRISGILDVVLVIIVIYLIYMWKFSPEETSGLDIEIQRQYTIIDSLKSDIANLHKQDSVKLLQINKLKSDIDSVNNNLLNITLEYESKINNLATASDSELQLFFSERYPDSSK